MLHKFTHLTIMLAVSVFGLIGIVDNGLCDTSPAVQSQEPAQTGKAPKALFPDPIHKFAAVMEGAVIKHDFFVENQGDAPLEIHKVQPD